MQFVAEIEGAGPVSRARSAFPQFELEVLPEVTSTQDAVREAALAGRAEGYCCRAEFQTAGRGRQDRIWVAPRGTALLFSLLLRPEPAVLPGVSLAAGLAVVDAVEATTGVVCGLKWPNDVMAQSRKLAGILAEIEARAGNAVILGAGLNLRVPEFPAEINGISLSALSDSAPDADALLVAIVMALRARLDQVAAGGIRAIRPDWLKRAVGIGGPVRARNGDTLISGTAVDIGDDGALLVATRDGVRRLIAGEVHLGS